MVKASSHAQVKGQPLFSWTSEKSGQSKVLGAVIEMKKSQGDSLF
jgi:hypothetical protein